MQVTSGRSPIILDDPFQQFAEARTEAPVYWDTKLRIWRVHSYADVEPALSDYKTFSSKDVYTPFYISDSIEGLRPKNPLVGTLGDIDPPYHRYMRSFAQQSFTIRQVVRLSSRIYQICHELFDRLEHKREFEFITEFGRQMPLLVLAAMFDIPEDDQSKFMGLAYGFVSGQTKYRLALALYFNDLFKWRRSELGEDFISDLLRGQPDERELTVVELLGYCLSVLYAGSHTMTYMLSNALICFSQFPEQFELLIKDPQLITSAIEEVLRYRSPIFAVPRVAAVETIIGGQTIQAGQPVGLLVASANHDETIFPNAEQLDITRQPNPHLAFGRGIHYCIGAPLARLEGKIFLEVLLERMPNLHVVPGSVLERIPPSIFFGYTALPVTQSKLD